MDLNTLPDANPLDGTELIPVLQNGIWCKAPLPRVLSLPAPTFAADPTAFTATMVDHESIDLAWSGSGTNYILERCRDNDGAWVEIYSGATASFSDTGLYPEERYDYRVKAQDTGDNDSEWVYANATTDAAP